MVLEDNGLKEFINSDVPKPGSSDAALLDAWQKKKATPFLMWKALTNFFQRSSDQRKPVLKDKPKKNKNGEGRQDSIISHEVCPL